MDEFRCECGALLAKEDITTGRLEIKCPKCNRYRRLERVGGNSLDVSDFSDYHNNDN